MSFGWKSGDGPPTLSESDSGERLWRQAYVVFGELLDLEPGERESRLAAMDLVDGVRARVRQLLIAHDGQGPLDAPLADLATVQVATHYGDWQVGEELGRGGMGVVYRAVRRTAGFEQVAALKILRLGLADAASVARFEREQQILARLEHPNIAGLIDGGVTAEGTPFLVLREVDGMPIDEACRVQGASVEQIVDWLLEACAAVAYAHGQLIVHRDLKPGNIMVDRHSQVQLLDFGVAKLLDEEAPAAEATRVLTPGYGSPEQESGAAVTTASDVYGLGAVLYRLLAGQAIGHDGATAHPSASAKALPGIDADLDNIVAMAMRREPSRRFRSVEALAEDLRRWRGNLPISATPDSLAYRMRKLISRHRLAVAAGLISVMSLTVGSVVALRQAGIARQEAANARQSAARAALELERAEAVSDFLVATFSAAHPSANQVEEITARDLLDTGSEQIEAGRLAPAVRRQLRGVLGEISYWIGDLERAEALLGPIVDEVPSPEVAAGPELDQRLRNLRFAARVASKAGNHELARQRLDAAVRLAPRAGRSEQFDLEFTLAATLLESGNDQAGCERLEALIERGWMAEATTPQRARVHWALASGLERLGRLDEARQHAEATLELIETGDGFFRDRRGWSSVGIERASVMGVLANIEASLGQVDRAAELLTEAIEIRSAVLGRDHPEVLVMRNDLATMRKNQGRFEESANLLEALLVDQTAALGEGHPYLAYTRFNLAQALQLGASGAADPVSGLQLAIHQYRQAFDQALGNPAAFGSVLAAFQMAYGRALGLAGRHQEAEQQLLAGLARTEQAEVEDPRLPRYQTMYAAFLNDRGRYGEARRRVEPALAALAQSYGEGSRFHALARLEEGRARIRDEPTAGRVAIEEALAALGGGQFRLQYAHEIALGEALLADSD